MKPIAVRSLAGAAGALAILCAAAPAHAEIVDLSLQGKVSYLYAVDYPPGIGEPPEYSSVQTLGSLSVGEDFVLHFVFDTEADLGLSADLTLSGGAHYSEVPSSPQMPFWNAEAHLLHLSSQQDHPTYFAGLHLTAPAAPAGEVTTLQALAEFYRDGPDHVGLYAPLYECGGTARDCSPGEVSFAVTGVSVSSVPEPTSLALLLAGAVAMGAVSSRRR